MLAVRRFCLGSSLLVLSVVGCDRSQPLEPSVQPLFRIAEAPSSANAVAVSESRIDISWQDNSPNETGFEVHRSTDGAGGVFGLLASTGGGVTDYADVGLNPLTEYCYKIRAFRTAFPRTRYSQFSATACATTPELQPPAAPWLRVADSYPHFVQLWFLDTSTNADGFKVERCAGLVCGDLDFAVIAAMAAHPGLADYFPQDATGVSGTTYTYRVRAFNRAGDSAPSNQISAYFCFALIDEEGYYVCG